ncbi:alpha/beta fold hydrolase [Tsukamurella hominis]|uniref:alpha/beta fold hydrolase n=1 Tax=Tsukamurella hominis TaxID=1970232 RepID=UPI0039E9BD34
MTGAAHQPDGLVAVVRGSGIPIVLLHGLSIDHRMMLPIDPIMAATGPWQRHYIDFPGHGRSVAVTPMSTGHIVDVVATHLRAALGGGRFAVIGASYGGAVAIALTEMFGDRVLGSALIAPAVLPRRLRTLPPPGRRSAEELAFLASLSDTDRTAFGAVTARSGRDQWERFAQHVRPGLQTHDVAAVAELAASHAGEPARWPPTHRGRHLVVTGREDTVVGWRDQLALLDAYPHATYAVLDDCGHNPHLERPETVAALLTDWLGSLRA